MEATDKTLLEIKDLKKYFPVKAGVFRKTVAFIKAVDEVSFYIKEGETLGLVGESGCGKSTTGFTIVGLEEASGGEVYFDGLDVLSLDKAEMRSIRKEMQVIFQDPFASLNPRMSVGNILREPLRIHKLARNAKEEDEKIQKLLDSVGLTGDQMKRYPHEFSGGQRQRIAVARSLAVEPKLIIADEPVSALDVSIQAQVINLLEDLQKEFNLTYLFISHDLGVVKHIADRVAVMYLGKIVETAKKKDLYNKPLHPYTQSLLSAIPVPDPEHKKERIILEGDVPSPIDPPAGCRFHPRCPKAFDMCKEVEPESFNCGSEHWVSCHLMRGSSVAKDA